MIARIIIGIIVVLVIVYVCCGFRIVPQNNEPTNEGNAE